MWPFRSARLELRKVLQIECQIFLILKAWRFSRRWCRRGSFVGAADELRLSKATVSKAISRLEKKFGIRLFNRTARRLAVTETGRQLFERAAHILAEGEAAESEVTSQSVLPRGHGDLRPPSPLGCFA